MGLQDRDYYRERHQKITNQENAELFRQSDNGSMKFRKNPSTFKYFLLISLMFGLFIYGADVSLHKIEDRKANGAGPFFNIPFIKSAKQPELIPGGIILRADHQGHFRGTVLINNVPMRFMIDTGATDTTIPARMAYASGLPIGNSFQSSTAGGKVLGQKTHIDSLKIGTAEIKNIDGNINPYLDEVLIGMNTLKYFHITQSVNTLTLVAFTKPAEIAEIEKGLIPPALTQGQVHSRTAQMSDYEARLALLSSMQPDKGAATNWKKTVICEGNSV